MHGVTEEQKRLDQAGAHKGHWRRWGPYLSERQWGTVREDNSPDGTAREYFPHDSARSRAYRWGEDGLLGISDNHQRLCFALALWNGRDPILKERLFGLNNSEGNHGEDVKEYCYYLDNTPTHSYMKALYKYPQAEFPYSRLIEENRSRTRDCPEFELIQTGIFDQDRYFDVMVEYAKAGTDDILIRITATNRGPDPATLHLLPTLWFRNTWSWNGAATKPLLRLSSAIVDTSVLENRDATQYSYFGLASVSFLGRPIDLGCSRRPSRTSSAAINFVFPVGRPVRVRIRIVASIFSSSLSASHADQSSVLTGTNTCKHDNNGSVRSPQ